MHIRIVLILAALFIGISILRLFPHSFVTRLFFSYHGPTPSDKETLARYQYRWALYSINWLVQIILGLVIVLGLNGIYYAVEQSHLAQAALFALSLGALMSIVAAALFLVKAAKARFIGPNPRFIFLTDDIFVDNIKDTDR